MKKFYALMAAGITVFGASAINPFANSFIRSEVAPVMIEKSEISKSDLVSRVNGLQEMAFSRADEEVNWDPAEFTQMLYYDYFDLVTLSDGTKVTSDDQMRWNLHTGAGVGMTWNEDGSVLEISELGGAPFVCHVYFDEGGAFLNLGEVVYESGGYTYLLSNWDDEIEGKMYLEAYLDALVLSDEVSLAISVNAYNSTTGEFGGYGGIFVFPMFILPNATLTYSTDVKNSETGEYEPVEFVNRIYAEFKEADPEDSESLDTIYMSNVNYFNSGIGVEFEYYMEMWLATEQIAMATQKTTTGAYTGDYYLYGVISGDDGKMYIDDTVVLGEETENGLIWPTINTEYDFTADCWGVLTQSLQYGYVCTPATFAFDTEATDGIKDVQLTEDVNAPAVYYNIQGMEVANPVAGQIYIVKQGNKVSKQVIR